MSTAASTVLQALRAGDVIPNVVPESATAGVKSALRVHYPEYTISEGEAIPRAATLKQPDLEFQNAIAGQVRHWLQSGVRFDETSKRTAAATSATALNDYVPPSPAYGTGKHRYVFIAAKEPAGYAGPQGKDFPTNGPADLKDRMRFDAARYCSEENLTIEAVGFMQVDADAAATKDNIALTGEAIKNAIIGK
ncbi:hypothetical protein C6P46_005066 [Rhodotorula mucilaginosa]|uniref:PEBP-like protein n=1 Tax=Rhodotorula mucilaginosa TaxID=5537 RepID=A0A9P7B5G4_RHOMI|nr:hypothetical protein C6P46_005066 [Rhodotorula mucilaginosa]